MAKSEFEEVTQKTIRNGGILTKLYFDMQSEKEEELQPLMTDLINNRLLKAPGVVYCFGSIEKPMKLDDIYSTSAIVTALFKDLGAAVNVVFNFAPAGIEVIEPEGHYTMKISDLNGVLVSLSDISAEYSKYILTRVLSKEDLEKVNSTLKARSELGKKMLEGGSKPGS
ncbi:MAG: hypothetical protein KGH67_00685 [Candidatus Micrarchaeota archaeon]|nr:hypothetical protein [Candidatus Micrarchaeota archaeon]MDE1859025.1 hypothetical protein [Candidatus Micrarchaeota archaeon]